MTSKRRGRGWSSRDRRFPVVRPRRLRRTPALRRLVVRRRAARRPTWSCRCSSRRASTDPAPDRVDAGRRPAHPRLAAQGRRRGGRGRRRRADAVRHPARQGRARVAAPTTRTASCSWRCATWSPRSATRPCVMSRPVPRRVHRPRPLRAAHRRRRRRQRRDPRALRRRSRSRRPRAGVQVVGPSGMMDGQVGAIRTALDERRLHRRRDPGLLREVRLGVVRPVPRRRRVRAAVRRPRRLPAGPGALGRARRCARSRSTSPRAPTW